MQCLRVKLRNRSHGKSQALTVPVEKTDTHTC
ncbi:hypothetical protein GALL_517110 [mine drainage metagenome]|uniref:Uncharacterized protein n=1 Tax=mine drainage metagenome TaxID=410659 RepID=A0A1J5PGN0_9ZZZZ